MEKAEAGWENQVRYQDYIIKNGAFIGNFDQMYRDCPDPWNQIQGGFTPDKSLALRALKTLGVKRVLELGSGLGKWTDEIRKQGFDVLGIDSSPTAIEIASESYPACRFVCADVLDVEIYRVFKPQAIILSNITWYILGKLDALLRLLKAEAKDALLIHLLVTYPPGVQRYGVEKFTDLAGIMRYFDMDYLEWAEIHSRDKDTTDTYFMGKWQ